jgi:hypothetical protein
LLVTVLLVPVLLVPVLLVPVLVVPVLLVPVLLVPVLVVPVLEVPVLVVGAESHVTPFAETHDVAVVDNAGSSVIAPVFIPLASQQGQKRM